MFKPEVSKQINYPNSQL